VYELTAGSRVRDAVQAAGGLAADADASAINLAALLVDGQSVVIKATASLDSSPAQRGNSLLETIEPASTRLININTAVQEELDELPDIPGIYRYDRGNYDQLLNTVVKATQEIGTHDREALAAAVNVHTPENYAKAHEKGFKRVLEGKREQVAFESDRHGKRGVYYVAYGEPARRCAEGAITSFKKYLPDIPVALVSDRPLGMEDIYIELPDYDIGGRAAKIKIYDLAPKDWQYICYLDADTEIIATSELLWQLVEDGWDMAICKNLEGLRCQPCKSNKDEYEQIL
jgi:hypothetical protein